MVAFLVVSLLFAFVPSLLVLAPAIIAVCAVVHFTCSICRGGLFFLYVRDDGNLRLSSFKVVSPDVVRFFDDAKKVPSSLK